MWNEFKMARQTYGRHSHLTLQKLFNFNEANATLRSVILNAQTEYEENLTQNRSTI